MTPTPTVVPPTVVPPTPVPVSHKDIRTGRDKPINLKEQLAKEEANSGVGEEVIPADKIGDPRFKGGDWARCRCAHYASDGTKCTVY
jgi:hypothetical protein